MGTRLCRDWKKHCLTRTNTHTHFLSPSRFKGGFYCGDPDTMDPGMVSVSIPELTHSDGSLLLELVPAISSSSGKGWGLAGVRITLDPTANPGCNECSKPHMTCSNGYASAECGCAPGYYLSGSQCLDIDECAVQGLQLESVFSPGVPPVGWVDAATGNDLLQVQDCAGQSMLGGFGVLGRYSRPERTFSNLAGHTSLGLTLTLFALDQW